MRKLISIATSLGLILVLGPQVIAQSEKPDEKPESQKAEKPDDQKGEKPDGQKAEKSDDQKDKDQTQQGSGQVETIRGELVGVSVVGETIVNYKTGRSIVAEFSYLTILGSPDGARGRGQGGRPEFVQDASRKSDQDPDRRPGRPDGASRRRRVVYEIAISPDTQVRSLGAQTAKVSDENQQGSARERSQVAFGKLELGDQVEVEFDRLKAPDQSPAGGEAQLIGASMGRHGRHRIIRGVAKTLAILPAPEGTDDQEKAQDKEGDASEKKQDGADDAQKKSDN